MFKIIKKIIKYPRVTQNYPKYTDHSIPFIGKPEIDLEKCTRCGECMKRCPSHAIVLDKKASDIGINYDECVFCGLCEDICPVGAAVMTSKFELAEKDRNKLRKNTLIIGERTYLDKSYEIVCSELKANIHKTFGRSLHIRAVDAGSCNGCDSEINGLSNPFNDSERLGINFVASPRHADMLLVTGAATRNMQLALAKTYNATPDPKLVVAVGACACSGGIFKDTYATSNGIDRIVPVDVYIPGCPPRPQAILYGILKALDRV
ncbi:NADH-quinone oxidoreductase subunit NuoB [Acetobacterium bakii]|uniref:Hydrogenase n=1 Tax=Acetobacterium bakii TaxID=52689 RepID=A0A0L6TZV9_9FIRM|nr:NADH-quinone oxidoreductase subunit NuoB [Acetobacterium bakii]KNZ41796.1 hydrogenase [Acetobacterium bakii]